MVRPTIVCTGICNTKGPEIRYMAEMVAAHGGEPLIMDLSLGAAVEWADVSLGEVLATAGTSLEEVFSAPRARASALVGRAGGLKMLDLRAAGRCDGVLSWAGSVGTATTTRAMRALPIGVPRIMLTDMTSGDVGGWVGGSDIYIVNPILEQGINAITRRIVANAAAGIVAMAGVPEVGVGAKPLCAITSYGTTTPTVLRCRDFMEARGWETAVFHAVGAGAAMEDLIREGLIGAVLDITTAELMNTLAGSSFGIPGDWEGERLRAAGEVGVPQVILPGGLDQCAFGPLSSVPEALLDDHRRGRRRSHLESAMPYIHNSGVTIVTPTLAEVEEVSTLIAARLNGAEGPTAFILPMRGWSAYDQSAMVATRARGWAEGNGDGPVWEPDPDRPQWSRRATRMLRVLERELDPTRENLDLLAVDMHLLDPELADLVTGCMVEMLESRWVRGAHRHLDIRGRVE